MAKLFPPLIDSTIPAFYEHSNGMVEITIPFSMNRAVSKTQVKGFSVKLKTVQSSSYLYSINTTDTNNFNIEDSPWVTFQIPSLEHKLRVGQFYKMQIAYIDQNGEIGYYSTIGIGKYTSQPTVYIHNLTVGLLNSHLLSYTGFYQNDDSTERVYSYEFRIYNGDGTLLDTSGEQLHNSQTDIDLKESYDTFLFARNLELDLAYFIQYTITTTNQLIVSSPKYRIMQKRSIEPEIKATLNVTNDFENGYIDINLKGILNDLGVEDVATGAFLLSRSCEDTNYTTWDEISRFKLQAQLPSRYLGKDFTVEQGKHYCYSLQQYNDNGLYSNRILSNIIYADFEDAFLFDGERQLKIKYNPKVSTFKVDALEAKVDTIGSKHPFIFRNGNVYYREFPISGLISYYMDEDNLFLTEEEAMIDEKTTQLTGQNIQQERNFKLKVLEWLTNGKTKLFRSPSEGNFIVRLMNTSLTPIDSLGRMLHTFNTTAYEVADFTYQNLSKYGFINITDPEVKLIRWETVNFSSVDKQGKVTYKHGKVNEYHAYTVRFSDMMPGDVILVKFRGQEEKEIKIGATGSYYIDCGVSIENIVIPETLNSAGNMTYSYFSIAANVFDKIADVHIEEVPVRQFIGAQDIIQEIEYVYTGKEYVRNPKIHINEFYNIAAERRDIRNIVYKDKNYYTDRDCTHLLEQFDPFTLYAIGEWKAGQAYRPGYQDWTFAVNYYYDSLTNKMYSPTYEPYIYINDVQISVEDSRVFEMRKAGEIEGLRMGNGVTVEASYQLSIIDYQIEDDPKWGVLSKKNEYHDALDQLNSYLATVSPSSNPEVETQLRNQLKRKYNEYIITLAEEQEKEKIAEGLMDYVE